MANNSELAFSFFQLLYDDSFTTQLRLPPQFMKDHGQKLSENVELHVEESGECSPWIVKLERVGKYHYFTDGWATFSRVVDLKLKDFLLFKLVEESTLEVSVYDTSGCEKEFCSIAYAQGNCVQRTEKSKKRASKDENEHITNDRKLVKKLTKDDAFELEIPRDLAMSRGIVSNRKVRLQYREGKKWPIYVSVKQCGKVAITGGWNQFLTESKVVVGSTVSFKFVGNVIETKVLKKGVNGEIFAPAPKKKRGRPPKLSRS